MRTRLETSAQRVWRLRHFVRWLGRVSVATISLLTMLQGRAVAQEPEVLAPTQPANTVAAAVSEVRADEGEVAAPAEFRGTATVTVLGVHADEVKLALSAPVAVHHDYLHGGGKKADRCYVDLSPAAFHAQAHSVFTLSSGPLQKVRVSQFHQGVVRVVLDLRGAHDCRVSAATEPGRLTITVAEAQGARTLTERQKISPAIPLAQEPMSSPPPGDPLGKAILPVVNWRFTTQFEILFPLAHVGVPLPPASVLEAGQDNPASPEQLAATPAINESHVGDAFVEKFPESDSLAVPLLGQEPTYSGGAMMHAFWEILMGVSLLLSFVAGAGVMFVWNKQKRETASGKREQVAKSDGWETRMAYLEEAVNRAGMLNSSFFHSLEVTQKRLEALLTQADVAEQNLRRLLHQTALTEGKSTGRGSDSYSTAASLLAEGENVQQVARVLKLPVAQVRVLQELRQSMQEEKSAGAQEKSAEAQHSHSLMAGLKSLVTQLNGASHSGMPLAHNG